MDLHEEKYRRGGFIVALAPRRGDVREELRHASDASEMGLKEVSPGRCAGGVDGMAWESIFLVVHASVGLKRRTARPRS